MNAHINNGKNTVNGEQSMFGSWRYGRKGFQLLEQYSDGENEALNESGINGVNEDSEDETFTRPPTRKEGISTNKTSKTSS